MNDELDLIRRLRPPIGGPSPEVVHRNKEHLMEYIDTSTRHRRRPRARIAAGIAVPVIAITGVAAAAGLLPSAVTDRFGELEDRGGGQVAIDEGRAAIVGQAEAGGYRVELWTASTSDDRHCLYVRSIWESDGALPAENGPVGCFDTLPVVVDPEGAAPDGSDLLGVLNVFPVGHPSTSGGDVVGPVATAITGAVDPTVASLDIEFQDGRHVVVDVADSQGWITELIDEDLTRPDENGVLGNPAIAVALRSVEGSELAVLDHWSRLQPTVLAANP